MGSNKDTDGPRSADFQAGFDENDPYEDTDLSAYPEWWRQNVEQFKDYGMRPYRPPRCEDGTVLPELISDLESELDVTIQLRGIDPRIGDDWSIFIDSKCIAQISRERASDGHTEYHMTGPEFERLVRSELEESGSDSGAEREPESNQNSGSESQSKLNSESRSESMSDSDPLEDR